MCKKGLSAKNVQGVDRYYRNQSTITKKRLLINYSAIVNLATKHIALRGSKHKKDNLKVCRLFLIDFLSPGGV
jgi:hypothetical protein